MFLTVEEAASKINKTRSWVRQLIWAGKLPAIKRAGVYFVEVKDLEALPYEQKQ